VAVGLPASQQRKGVFGRHDDDFGESLYEGSWICVEVGGDERGKGVK